MYATKQEFCCCADGYIDHQPALRRQGSCQHARHLPTSLARALQPGTRQNQKVSVLVRHCFQATAWRGFAVRASAATLASSFPWPPPLHLFWDGDVLWSRGIEVFHVSPHVATASQSAGMVMGQNSSHSKRGGTECGRIDINYLRHWVCGTKVKQHDLASVRPLVW